MQERMLVAAKRDVADVSSASQIENYLEVYE